MPESSSQAAVDIRKTMPVSSASENPNLTANFKKTETNNMEQISWNDFLKIELRVGRIIEARDFPEARKPAYLLKVDFGDDIGVKKSSAQITRLYSAAELVGKLVVGVVNFPPKQIGPIRSECLVTGFHNPDGDVVLCVPEKEVPPGTRLL